MRGYLDGLLGEASPDELTTYLTAGIRNDEVRGGFGLVTSLLAFDDFLIDPLPNLLFTRDSCVWIRDRVAITSLAMPARKRETELTELIYTRHPRFVGTPRMHGAHLEHVEGGDVLLLAPGVIAVGVGERTTAGRRRAAGPPVLPRRARAHRARRTDRAGARDHAPRHDLHAGRHRQDGRLPQRRRLAGRLHRPAHRRRRGRRRPGARRRTAPSRSWSRRPRRWASTPCTRSTPAWTRSPPSASSGTTATTPWRSRRGSRWPTSATTRPTSGSRTPGIEVVRIAGSELGSGRGGPRCMSCPISREPLG